MDEREREMRGRDGRTEERRRGDKLGNSHERIKLELVSL
jgi:hypothetical protein